MIRAIVIDDEAAGIEMIKILASRIPALIKIVASTLDPEKGITLIEDYAPDVVFLDISMPLLNGFDLLAKLSFRNFKLIFTTAHKEYAIDAFKVKAFDYLLKPIDSVDFAKCVEVLSYEENKKKISLKPQNLFALIEVQVKDGIIYILQKDIIRLEASRSYTEIYLDNKQRHVVSKSLRELEVKLDPALFYRCHKSHIINLQKVQKFVNHNGLFALMGDGSMPDISKNNKEELLELLKRGG